jgi:hypothetical protein
MGIVRSLSLALPVAPFPALALAQGIFFLKFIKSGAGTGSITRVMRKTSPRTRSAASPMFQLKLNDIELVSKPEYYLKYIIAIIGDTRMLKTEGCAPVVAQRENQHLALQATAR